MKYFWHSGKTDKTLKRIHRSKPICSRLPTIIFVSVFLKKIREEKYVQIFADEYLVDSQKGEEQLDYPLFLEKLNRIIDMLPPRRKEILLLSYKEELKNYEIAEKLGLSDHHVKKQLVIARKFVVDKVREDSGLAGILFLYLFMGQKTD